MRLGEAMTSVPKVNPGDAVFWHCDVVHAVETDHVGTGDSAGKYPSSLYFICRLANRWKIAVMYIPAVPMTPQNLAYIERQKASFLSGERPPDFPKGEAEAGYIGVAGVDDVISTEGKRAMGLLIDSVA